MIKIIPRQHFHRRQYRIFVHDHGANDRLFCIQTVWHASLDQSLLHEILPIILLHERQVFRLLLCEVLPELPQRQSF